MKIFKGDKVKIIAGKDRGKEGVVDSVSAKRGTIIINDLNLYKKHVKKSEQFPKGGIIELPREIDVAKVMLICPHTHKPTRVGYKMVDGVKKRVSKASKKVIS